MSYAQKYDIFFPFFIKVVVNKSKAYSFLIIGMMHLQKNITFSYNAAISFFTAKQGTWAHKDDRGPYYKMKIFEPYNSPKCKIWSFKSY